MGPQGISPTVVPIVFGLVFVVIAVGCWWGCPGEKVVVEPYYKMLLKGNRNDFGCARGSQLLSVSHAADSGVPTPLVGVGVTSQEWEAQLEAIKACLPDIPFATRLMMNAIWSVFVVVFVATIITLLWCNSGRPQCVECSSACSEVPQMCHEDPECYELNCESGNCEWNCELGIGGNCENIGSHEDAVLIWVLVLLGFGTTVFSAHIYGRYFKIMEEALENVDQSTLNARGVTVAYRKETRSEGSGENRRTVTYHWVDFQYQADTAASEFSQRMLNPVAAPRPAPRPPGDDSELYDQMDTDGSGELSIEEVVAAIGKQAKLRCANSRCALYIHIASRILATAVGTD